tara:strand:- start:95 stop:709 length:615 start_codon:yes stop_codon:yes gene_type:complete
MKVIKKAVSEELSNFLTHYIRNYKKTIAYMMHEQFISHDFKDLGTWKDQQVPQTFSHYSNHAMETLMEQLTPVVEKATGKELYEVFSYVRAYKTGDILEPHKDRDGCDVAVTIHLGGDPWSIFIEYDEVILEQGDLLIYDGTNEVHYRDRFEGKDCIQCMLMYSEDLAEKYDGRKHLGLPSYFNKRDAKDDYKVEGAENATKKD